VVRSSNGGRLAPSLEARTERPTIPEGSRLTAAEIQAQIRAGRGVRAVAEMAEAPVDWVRYLAEPVMAEKAAILRQVLTARPQRPRAKGPGDPLGRALLLALRARKVPSPEHVLANGFTAYRRGHGPWRVRLAFRKDGRRYSALWAFDPRTNRIEPRNDLADELGWRRVSPARWGPDRTTLEGRPALGEERRFAGRPPDPDQRRAAVVRSSGTRDPAHLVSVGQDAIPGGHRAW
jgi:hypothetical protein